MGNFALINNGILWEFDPTDRFKGQLTPDDIVEMLGLLPNFFDGSLFALPREEFIEQVMEHYQFGGPPMTGGSVDRDGVYEYPADPPLYPLAQSDIGSMRVYIYQYGIVAFVHREGTSVYRMD